jgi:quinol monooxygenase YgiN
MMIVIRVQMNVQPEMREQFLELLGQEALNVRGLEGCVCFEVFRHLHEENTLLLYEEWQTQDAFDVYRTSDAFKENGQKLFPMMSGQPDSAYYSAEAFS